MVKTRSGKYYLADTRNEKYGSSELTYQDILELYKTSKKSKTNKKSKKRGKSKHRRSKSVKKSRSVKRLRNKMSRSKRMKRMLGL